MYNSNRSNLLRTIMIGVIAVIAVLILWFIATHGFVSAGSVTKNTPLTYLKSSDSLSQTVKTSTAARTILGTGVYSFGIPIKDGGVFVAEGDIPRFLLTTKLAPEPFMPLVKTLGRSTFPDLIHTSSGLASHEADTFRPVDKNNITNDNLGDSRDDSYPDFTQSVIVSDQSIGGLVKTSGGMQPILYDTVTKTQQGMPLLTDVPEDKASIKSDNGIFSSFNLTTGEIQIYSNAQTASLKLANSDRLSKNEGHPIYSVTSGRIAVTTGSDFVSTNDNEGKASSSSQTVKVFDGKSKQNLWEQTYTHSPVQNVSLSPDGSHIAIQTTTATAIYDVATSTLQMTIPYGSTKFLWADNQRFVFISQADGIFSGSIATKTAQTIAPYGRIRPTNLSFINGSKVYFTGFSSADENTQNPATFEADLNTAASSQANAALQKFPHQGDGFYVDLLDDTVTIQTTRYVGKIAEQTNEFATQEDLSRLASQGDYTIDTTAQAKGLKYATDALGGSLRQYIPRYSYVDLDF